MKEKWNKMVELLKEGERTRLEFMLMIAVAFLSGLVLGMFFSPKKHVMIGSNNGNNSPGCLTFDATEEDEEEEAEKN